MSVMPKKSSPGEKYAPRQISLAGVLLFVVAMAGVLGLTQVWPLARIGTAFFWLALSAPIWVPDFAMPGHTHTRFPRRSLSFVAVVWYIVLMLMWPERRFVSPLATIVIRGVVIVGTLVALAALLISARGWRHLVTVPLWIAILLGSVSVFFAY
jgi:hypothetical protein